MNKQTEAKPTAEAALKMAIEALDDLELCDYATAQKAIQACKEALEQPAQEPLTRAQQVIRANNSAQEPLLITRIAFPESNIQKPAEEPVAWLWLEHGKPRNAFLHEPMQYNDDGYWTKKGFSYKPLYTHRAPSWQGLSDDEIVWLCPPFYDEDNLIANEFGFARAIEQALRERNCNDTK